MAILIICKLFLWPVLGWLLISRRYRAAGVASSLTGATLMAGWLCGPLDFRSYTSLLHVLSGIEAPHASSFSGLLLSWHASLSLATTVSTGTALVLLGLVGYWARRRQTSPGEDALAFGTAVLAALLASPIVWHHYYLLLTVPLVAVTRSVWPFVALSLASWVAAAPHTTSLDRTIEGYVLGIGGIAAISLIAVIRSWPQRRPPELTGVVMRPGARTAIGPVALATALTALLVGAISALQRVPVGVAWGPVVTLVEVVAVLAFVWARTTHQAQTAQ